MVLSCRKRYDLEPNLLLILLAAGESHLQQGILAMSLGISKNTMVFLIDDLEQRGLIKRVANPDNRLRDLSNARLRASLLLRK